jgi:AraC family transcriptional regulator, transcriptional activator of pobA
MNQTVEGLPNFQIYGRAKDNTAFEVVDCVPFHIMALKNRWLIDAHFHDALLQIFLLRDGGGRCTLDDQILDINSPAIIFIPPTIVHGFNWIKGSVGWVLSIEQSYLEQLIGVAEDLAESFMYPRVILCENRLEELNRIDKLLENITIEVFEKTLGFKLATKGAVAQVLSIVGRISHENKIENDKIDHQYRLYYKAFHRLVRQSYLEKKSIDDYAIQLKISRMHLNRICRSISGKPALNIIHDYIISEAKRALIYTSMNISEIAEVLNFEDPAYFSRFFKRYVSISPTLFRIQHKFV